MLDDHKHKHAVHEFDGIVENRVSTPPVYFNILFYGLIIWGIAFCAYYLLSGWSSEAEFQEKMAAHTGTLEQIQAQAQPLAQPQTQAGETAAAAARPSAQPLDGEALYAAECSACHGQDATGGFGPDLTAASYQHGKSPAEIRESISAGRGANMPGYAGQLSDAEIDSLVEYLLQL
jgi:cytochrome c oxidase cbb3-type subunit 3